MRQFYKKLVPIVTFLVIYSLHARAYDCVVDGIYYNLHSDSYYEQYLGSDGVLRGRNVKSLWAEVVSGNYSGYVTIPDSIIYDEDTYLVKSIHDSAFFACTDLYSIDISDNVTSIGQSAFRGCTSLASVTIPKNVVSINRYLFEGCSSLSSVNIPNGVVWIYDCAFENCSALSSVIIPASVNHIGCAFKNCSALTSISIPDGVLTIGPETFRGCVSLASIDIPGSIQNIDSRAFQECSSLMAVTIPDGITRISEYTFYKCSSMTSVMIPDGVTMIDEGAFSKCESLTSLVIPGTVKTIGRGAFSVCSNLSDVQISNGVENLEYGAFNKCYSLSSLVIPNSVKSIGEYAFNGCRCSIICLNETPPSAENSSFNYNMTAYVPASAIESYRNADGWKEMEIKEVTAEMIGAPEMNVTATAGPSHLFVTGGYGNTSITVTEFGFEGYEPFEDEIEVYGLDPETEYAFTFYIDTKEAGRIKKECTFRTSELKINTTDPKVVSVENGRSNVIVSVQTNLDDNEKNVGFEWRREDAPEALRWNSAKIPLYDGMMEGYIRNVQADKFWWVRPYYLSDSGNYYYGEQVMWDANDISYCEPVVHTSKKVKISKNIATVEGYALSGTENISSQGMKYWKATNEGGEASEKQRDDAAEVKASGYSEVMTVDIKGLEYDATYNYVAFVMTADGKTYYGETRVFTTEPSPADVNVDGIVDISDIVAVINHIAGTNDYRRADVNADGLVDISDIVAIINAIASM